MSLKNKVLKKFKDEEISRLLGLGDCEIMDISKRLGNGGESLGEWWITYKEKEG